MLEKIKNEIIEREDYLEIVLNDGAITKISKEDFEKIKSHTWSHMGINKSSNGYAGINKYNKETKKSKSIHLNRYLFLDEIEKLEKENKCRYVVDHINLDTLDNRRENLRVCTYSQNLANKKNIKGYNAVNNKYIVFVKGVSLGTYNTLQEAEYARVKAEAEVFGEFGANSDRFEEFEIEVDNMRTVYLIDKKFKELEQYLIENYKKDCLGILKPIEFENSEYVRGRLNGEFVIRKIENNRLIKVKSNREFKERLKG